MKSMMLGWSFLLLSCTAWAAGPSEIRKQAQASMLVTGMLDVTPGGKVGSYFIDQQAKLPPAVVELLQKSIPAWDFQPVSVDGMASAVHAKMRLRIVAKPVDDQHDSIGIEAASFGDNKEMPGQSISRKTMVSPAYPELEVRSRVTGTVYALLKVGRDGKVEDVAAEQVNLGVYGNEHDMSVFRRDLANATLRALRQWTFNTPTVGRHVADAYWFARVPVNFNLNINGVTQPQDQYGTWQSYVPGPRDIIPWAQRSWLISAGPDAGAAGGVYPMSPGLELKTPLAGA